MVSSRPQRQPRVLTEGQLADFRRDGFLIVEDLIDPHAWTAIDEATIANGCLWMAAGSHRWGMIPDAARDRVESLLAGGWPTVPIELRPGSVSFHHPGCV